MSFSKNIFIEKDEAPSRETVENNIGFLREMAEKWDTSEAPEAREVLMKIVPTFRLPKTVNLEAEKSEEMKIVN